MVINKKIKNATRRVYNNIKFRSILELSCYKLLEQSNLQFEYESEKFKLFEGIKPGNIVVVEPRASYVCGRKVYARDITVRVNKFRGATYTPDFKIIKGNRIIYVEVKGFINDTYPIKKTRFLQLLDRLQTKDTKNKYEFYEIHKVTQMREFIKKIEENGHY